MRTTEDTGNELCAQTPDGLKLCVRHLAGNGRGASVLLLHGFAQNRHTFHAPGHSFAAWLAGKGSHVFLGTLRGRHGHLTRQDRRHPHGFSHYVEHDATAMVELIKRVRPSAPLVVVGHSMGGLVAASLPSSAARLVDGIAAICSPLHFLAHIRGLRNVLIPSLRGGRVALPLGLPTTAVGLGLAAARHVLDVRWLPNLFPVWAPGSMDPALLRWALTHTFSEEGWRVLADLLELGTTTGRRAGDVPVGDRVRALRAPLLVMATDHDGLAPEKTVRPLYVHAGSPRKSYVVVGKRDSGAPVGHLDVLLGRAAPRVAWPMLADFVSDCARAPAQCSPEGLAPRRKTL